MALFSRFVHLLLALLITTGAREGLSQTVFSRFDFDSNDLSLATIGPDAVYIDPDTRQINGSLYVSANCGATKGFEVTIPNENGIFDVPSLGMNFSWEKHENYAHFFDRSGTSFFIDGGNLYMQYVIEDGMVPPGTTTLGPFATGYFSPNDNQYHEYTFEYKSSTGFATVLVDGNVVWTYDGPDERDLVWDTNVHPVVGIIMDGTCDQEGVLDYVEFYLPDESLPVDFLDVRARWEGTFARIEWVTANEVNNDYFTVERSRDGYQYQEVGQVEAAGNGAVAINHYELLDEDIQQAGVWWYRILQVDQDGSASHSESVHIAVDKASVRAVRAYPNPSNGAFCLQYGEGARAFSVVGPQGRLHYYQEIPEPGRSLSMEVQLPSMPPGVYQLVVHYPGNQEVLKLVIRD